MFILHVWARIGAGHQSKVEDYILLPGALGDYDLNEVLEDWAEGRWWDNCRSWKCRHEIVESVPKRWWESHVSSLAHKSARLQQELVDWMGVSVDE